tara:strand:- start:227 stop:403 length:177 start_codon:yes stop_codon:yes gene_type:complete
MPFGKFRVKPPEGAEEIIPRKIKNKVAIIKAMEEGGMAKESDLKEKEKLMKLYPSLFE